METSPNQADSPAAAATDASTEKVRGRIKILLVDDQEIVRRGLSMRLGIEPDLEVVGEAEDGAGALDGTTARAPDVVLMDVVMEGVDGIEATAALRLACPEVAIVVLTLQDDEATRGRAVAAGAAGFVGKHQPEGDLIEEIRRVGRPPGDEG